MGMAAPTGPELVALPPLKAVRGPNGGAIMTQKYIEGIQELARTWPGPITTLAGFRTSMTTDMDHVEIHGDQPVIAVEQRPDNIAQLKERLSKAAVVMTFLSPLEAYTGQICQELGVPLVYSSEYAPTTERQIVDAETQNPLLRLRRKIWIWNATRKRRAMVAQAAGLQCSGTPVYEAYRADCANSLLFFDNRVRHAEVLDDDAMAAKLAGFQQDRPLRLVFGGRLIAMKGVLELPKIAAMLTRQGTPYAMDIYGTGPLEDDLRAQIDAAGLTAQVHLKGALDFRTGWIPALKEQADLFICPHPQGDPSSTYPEVMSCGVPIVGYDNEAFRGVVAQSQGGVLTPMNRPAALAEAVARLDQDRAELVRLAQKARAFALEHSFEKTFARRATHLMEAGGIAQG